MTDSLTQWAGYLSAAAIERLQALKISERYTDENAMPFATACLMAQADADHSQAQIAIGWQINDVTGNKEPGWGPVQFLESLALEPVALLYPLVRNLPCKPRK